jgi:phage terminase small subunit
MVVKKSTKKPAKRKPTLKQQVFVEEVLKDGNATRAARKAGYKHPHVQGAQNLEKLRIRERIQARIEDAKVETNEVIGTLASHMRGDLADVVPEDEILQRAKEAGVSHLIKKLKVTTRYISNGPGKEPDKEVKHEFEMYSAQEAAKSLCGVLGLNKEAAKNPVDAAKEAYATLVREFSDMPAELVAQSVARRFKVNADVLTSESVH